MTDEQRPPISLDVLEGHAFEDIVERLLTKMGFLIHGRQASADGGIDMIADRNEPITGGKFVIQCKRYASAVGEPIIRDLYGVVQSERANKGILITTAGFTREAVAFAAGKPLELIDGNALRGLLFRHGITLEQPEGITIGPGIGVVYSQLCKPFDDIRAESQELSDGLAFVARKSVTLRQYVARIDTAGDAIESGINFLGPVLSSMAPLMSVSDLTREQDLLLRSNITQLLEAARALVEAQRQASAIVPPPEFARSHALFLKIVPEVLSEVAKVTADVRECIETGVKSPQHTIKLNLRVPSLVAREQLFKVTPGERLTRFLRPLAQVLARGLFNTLFGRRRRR
jgi:Restriction endonuclease